MAWAMSMRAPLHKSCILWPQVMLAYGMRRRLQAALLADAMPALAVDVRRVLEELDVQDDATLPSAARTRGKFRRCFGLEPPANALRLRGPLRVPPLG